MHFSVDPDAIGPMLRVCNKISDAKGFRPIYGYVRMEATEQGVLSLSVLDSYVNFTGNVEVSSVQKAGVVIVETDRLVSIFKTRVGGHDVELEESSEFLTIKQGEFRARLPLFRREAFPEFSLITFTPSYRLEVTPTLLANLSRCAEAVDAGPKDPFQGMLLDFETPNMLWVCGFSNALVHVHNSSVREHGGFRCVLAPSCLPILGMYSADVRTELVFDLEHNRAVFVNPVMTMSVTFVEDKYPRGYISFLGLQEMAQGRFFQNKVAGGQIVESLPKSPIEFRTAEFLGALESAASVLGSEDKAIEFRREERLSDGRGVAELIGVNRMTQAKASEKILSTDNLQMKLVVGIHTDKVSSTLRKFQSETFKFFVFDALSPIVLVEDGVPDFAAVTLPLRVA